MTQAVKWYDAAKNAIADKFKEKDALIRQAAGIHEFSPTAIVPGMTVTVAEWNNMSYAEKDGFLKKKEGEYPETAAQRQRLNAFVKRQIADYERRGVVPYTDVHIQTFWLLSREQKIALMTDETSGLTEVQREHLTHWFELRMNTNLKTWAGQFLPGSLQALAAQEAEENGDDVTPAELEEFVTQQEQLAEIEDELELEALTNEAESAYAEQFKRAVENADATDALVKAGDKPNETKALSIPDKSYNNTEWRMVAGKWTRVIKATGAPAQDQTGYPTLAEDKPGFLKTQAELVSERRNKESYQRKGPSHAWDGDYGYGEHWNNWRRSDDWPLGQEAPTYGTTQRYDTATQKMVPIDETPVIYDAAPIAEPIAPADGKKRKWKPIGTDKIVAIHTGTGTATVIQTLRAMGCQVNLIQTEAEAYTTEYTHLMLLGGSDVHPSYYGEKIRHAGPFDAKRDRVEWILARKALANNRPVFGICRGNQMLAIAAGGTLWQDVKDDKAAQGSHWAGEHKAFVADPLSKKIDAAELKVNSYHHQAVRAVPYGFQVAAWSEDNIIESIWRPGALGVQWHPELLGSPKMLQTLLGWFLSGLK